MSFTDSKTLGQAKLEEAHRRLRERGIIVHSPTTNEALITDFEPIPMKGKPLSEMILEERQSV
jgi:hypothetical protein